MEEGDLATVIHAKQLKYPLHGAAFKDGSEPSVGAETVQASILRC